MSAARVALTGGAWVTGRGGIRRWVPEPVPLPLVRLVAEPEVATVVEIPHGLSPDETTARRSIVQDLANQIIVQQTRLDEPLGHLCDDCDSLVFSGELRCLVCLTWAERDAVTASWRAANRAVS